MKRRIVFSIGISNDIGLKKTLAIACLILFSMPVAAIGPTIPEWWKTLHGYDGTSSWYSYFTYTSSYFGPNAMPVPEISDGKIPEKNSAEVSSDIFWGFGDQTQSLSMRVAYVIVPDRLSISSWGVLAEHYKTTMEIRDKRASMIKDAEESFLIGDFYISTLLGICRESVIRPALSLEFVLKTASSKTPIGARYFDTPGYYFDATAGKSLHFKDSYINEFRLAGTVGFLCYQMNSNFQNDAPIFGLETILGSRDWSWTNGMGGYSGWTGKGDRPLVLRSRFEFDIMKGKAATFVQYQHALRDYPYRRIQTGIRIDF